eukprot:6176030-Pyramimonas_sp.AAC.1
MFVCFVHLPFGYSADAREINENLLSHEPTPQADSALEAVDSDGSVSKFGIGNFSIDPLLQALRTATAGRITKPVVPSVDRHVLVFTVSWNHKRFVLVVLWDLAQRLVFTCVFIGKSTNSL